MHHVIRDECLEINGENVRLITFKSTQDVTVGTLRLSTPIKRYQKPGFNLCVYDDAEALVYKTELPFMFDFTLVRLINEIAKRARYASGKFHHLGNLQFTIQEIANCIGLELNNGVSLEPYFCTLPNGKTEHWINDWMVTVSRTVENGYSDMVTTELRASRALPGTTLTERRSITEQTPCSQLWQTGDLERYNDMVWKLGGLSPFPDFLKKEETQPS